MIFSYRKALVLLIAVSLSVGLRVTQADSRPTGGTLVIGDNNPPSIINPALVSSDISVSISHLIFSRLLRLNPRGEMEPELVQSWSVSDDGRIYSFNLRRKVRFHDGKELTSHDVRYTYETIGDPSMHSPYALDLANVARYENPSRYRFQIILKKPQPNFPGNLVIEILPAHIYSGAPLASNPANFNPIGSGPFKFAEWTPDGQITLEANDDYFEGRPFLDRVVFKTYQSKAEVWSALMRGEVDMARFLRVEDYEQAKKDSSFKTYALVMPLFYGVVYDLNSLVLKDLEVRQAISCAVNRDRMIQILEQGYGVESNGPFQPGHWAYNSNIQKFNYEPERSIQILRHAGWHDDDQDGILEKNGHQLTIRMLVDEKEDKLKKMAMSIRQDLHEVGIRLEVMLYQNKSQMIESKKIGTAQAHLMLFYGSGPTAHEEFKAWSSEDEHKEKVWLKNESAVEIDRLIFLGQTELNREERRRIYMQLQKTLYENQISCFLYFPYIFHALSCRVQNADELLSSTFLPDYFIKKMNVTNDCTEEVMTNGNHPSRNG